MYIFSTETSSSKRVFLKLPEMRLLSKKVVEYVISQKLHLVQKRRFFEMKTKEFNVIIEKQNNLPQIFYGKKHELFLKK